MHWVHGRLGHVRARLLVAAALMIAAPNALAAQVEVGRMWTQDARHETRVTLELGAATDYTAFSLTDPERIVFDLKNARLSERFEKGRGAAGLVQGIRTAPRHESDLRVVVDLNRPSRARHFLQPPAAGHGPRLIIRLHAAAVTGVEETTGAHGLAPSRERAMPARERAKSRPLEEPARVRLERGTEARLSTEDGERVPAQATAPISGGERESEKGNNDDQEVEFDIDAPPQTRNRLTPTLTWGGDVELKFEQEANFDLDDSEEDDVTVLKPDFDLALTYKPKETVEAFLNVSLNRQFALQEEGSDRDRDAKLNLKQFNVTFREVVDGLSFKLGRQRMEDEREWLYDDELDALRVFYRLWRVGVEGSISRKRLFRRNLLDDDDEDEEINNYFVIGRLRPYENADVALFALMRDDTDRRASRPIFLGAQLVGEAFETDYWFNFAHVRGKGDFNRRRDENDDLHAFGLDVGATYKLGTDWDPSITLAYAFGTGDSDPDDDVDRAFRQTGLQDNSDRFNGVTSFKYYGELFDPELSNMMIYTIGIGVKASRRSSIDLVYHHYEQHKRTDELRDADVEEDLPGSSRSLGDEVDLVLGFREVKKKLSFEFVLGYFLPGSAFGSDAGDAFLASMELRYRF